MAVTCGQCGQENPDGFRFCGACGAPLTEAPAPVRQVRKTVTVLFADVVGSTALGESRDPEAVRALMARWFEEARAILERHGGTVEKFIGDAVMAVFGVPRIHEDDALRAVRAAAELRRTELRIGVNTGEVVAGGGETIVTGDAVNVAARLEQAAGPGEVLIGARTHRLVRDAVEVEAVAPLDLKGKAEPVPAFRLVTIDAAAEGLARHLDSPLVGRRREQQRLRDDFDHVISERTCQLFTLLGPPGVGKSRLALDFLESADARVVRGRCLPYGEGITYWPLVEAVIQLGVEPETILGSSPAETQLAFRRLLEREAAERPLVVVFDDLHWAEETFLDLVEHVADWSRGAPIFLLSIARPELLDMRPSWGGGKMNATSILLEPLPAADAEQLVENLLDGGDLDAGTRARILTAADGNPLFVEEMIAMLREDGAGGDVTVPPTIHALLHARLDRLAEDERAVIERGAVEGEVFHQTAVIELAPEQVRPDVPQRLLGLVRKELIRRSTATLENDEAFRFRHLLIRDAAYDALPKATRAELHERFARWLEEHADLVEQEEIVGYHLEQAARYRSELGGADAALASAAAERLHRASQAADGRGDVAAAMNLARRALELLPEGDPQRLELLPSLVHLAIGRALFAEAEAHTAELAAAGDRRSHAYATLFRAEIEITRGTVGDIDTARGRIADATDALTEAADERGLAYAKRMSGQLFWLECQTEAAGELYAAARDHAERAGYRALTNDLTSMIGATAYFGPTPVEEALEATRRRLEDCADRPVLEASTRRGYGRLLTLVGEFDRARVLIDQASETLREAGLTLTSAAGFMARAFVERRAGDHEASEAFARRGADELRRLGDHRYFSTTAFNLAFELVELGRVDEAEQWLADALAEANPADVADGVLGAAVGARVAALRGDHARAHERAERAVELAERTDFFDLRTSAHETHGRVLALGGRGDDARAAFERALAITNAKGATAWSAQIEALLAEL